MLRTAQFTGSNPLCPWGDKNVGYSFEGSTTFLHIPAHSWKEWFIYCLVEGFIPSRNVKECEGKSSTENHKESPHSSRNEEYEGIRSVNARVSFSQSQSRTPVTSDSDRFPHVTLTPTYDSHWEPLGLPHIIHSSSHIRRSSHSFLSSPLQLVSWLFLCRSLSRLDSHTHTSVHFSLVSSH